MDLGIKRPVSSSHPLELADALILSLRTVGPCISAIFYMNYTLKIGFDAKTSILVLTAHPSTIKCEFRNLV